MYPSKMLASMHAKVAASLVAHMNMVLSAEILKLRSKFSESLGKMLSVVSLTVELKQTQITQKNLVTLFTCKDLQKYHPFNYVRLLQKLYKLLILSETGLVSPGLLVWLVPPINCQVVICSLVLQATCKPSELYSEYG